MLQDSALIRKIRTVIQNRCIRFLFDKSRKDPEGYSKFFADYGIFIKEGILSSQEQMEKEEMAKLIRYESSRSEKGKTVTLPEYINGMSDDQKQIYYLAAPSRELAEASPYFESLKVCSKIFEYYYVKSRMSIFLMISQLMPLSRTETQYRSAVLL